MVSKLFRLPTSYRKQSGFQMSTTCWQLHQILIFSPLNLSHGFISIKVQTIQYLSEKWKIRGKNPKNENRFCASELCFFSPSLLLIMWGTLRLICSPCVYKSGYEAVQSSSTRSSNMLPTLWCFTITNKTMSYMIKYQSKGPNLNFYLKILLILLVNKHFNNAVLVLLLKKRMNTSSTTGCNLFLYQV